MNALADTLGGGGALYGGNGFSWWQAVGAMLLVFALLILVLRVLARFQRQPAGGLASVARVVPLGPRRELEVVRLRDRAHFIYRRDGNLVLLGDEPWADYEAGLESETDSVHPWKRFFQRRDP